MNGVAEKNVDTTKNHTRSMLEACGIAEQLGWWRAVQHHVYLWNRTHIASTTGKTPYEAMLGRTPSIMHVGVFGCDAFVHQDKLARDTTFSPKAVPGVYLGHDTERNCSVVQLLSTGKVIYVKDVIFREGSFEHLRRGATEPGSQAVDIAELCPAAGSDPADARVSNTVEECEDESIEEQSTSKRYTVKCITQQRQAENGKTEFLVKWVGYAAPTWEPADVIREDAPQAVESYEEFVAQRTEARVTRSKSRGTAAATAFSSDRVSSSSAALASRQLVSDDEKSDSSESDHRQAALIAAARCL
jgi:hypothetical protein